MLEIISGLVCEQWVCSTCSRLPSIDQKRRFSLATSALLALLVSGLAWMGRQSLRDTQSHSGHQALSKPSAAEQQYMRVIGERMALGELRCRIYPQYVAVERHHPKGPLWETGTALKAHHWFVIPLSKRAHDDYHTNAEAFEAKHGSHAEIMFAFWREIGFVMGDFMSVGMDTKRAAWLKRVMDKLQEVWAG